MRTVYGPLGDGPTFALIDLISDRLRFGLFDTPTTTRQRFVTPFMTFAIPLIDVARFVNAAGLLPQSEFREFGPLLVIPVTVIRHVTDPAFIVAPDTLMVDGATNETVAVQPAPETDDVAPALKRNPLGMVSTNAMPDCAGLPATLSN